MKTRLGISVGMLGAALYFAGLFGGFVVLTILAGYTLLVEENEWVKKTAVKAFLLLVAFSLLKTLVGLIPDAIGVFDKFVYIFSTEFSLASSLSVVIKIVSFLTAGLDFIKVVLFLVLGLKALNQSTVKIGAVDGTVTKHTK